MVPDLFSIVGPWPGRLYLSARPRGGDWLEDEVLGWHRAGIGTVVSLLTNQEEQELDLAGEGAEARKHGLAFVSYPIPDRGIPPEGSTLANLLQAIERDLRRGTNVLVHCRQGIGRTGLVAASLLVRNGTEPESAIQKVSDVRGIRIPETPEQESCIYEVAANAK